MALLNSNEILEINKKIKTFVIVRAGSTAADDVDLFVVTPPPAVQDTAHRAPVQSMTSVCNTCQCALEYFSYYLDTAKSGGKAAVEHLPASYLLHAGVQTLLSGDDAECHLCVLIMADLRTKRLALESIDQSNIEMCWRSEELTPSLIHFALTHKGHERTTNNYWNFFKLQLWPCSEFDLGLFGEESSSEFERHGNTGSEHSRDRAVQWLSRCQANEDGRHNQCNQRRSGWLPTRLLDVTDALKTSVLKLVTPHDHPDAFVSNDQYLTLSHCWGAWGSKELPVLTTENLNERQTQGLDISLLPRTFKDALEIAQWFQVRWLWIDSLCIVQDSTDDWEQEAVMMYSVYKNALLNISADDSNDARWGCFRNRHPLTVCPMRLQIPGLDDWAAWLAPDSNAIFGAVSKAPLAKRAWVFQERQLSRRVLHFTSSELVWECCAEGPHFACEIFPEGAPLKTVFDDRPKIQSTFDVSSSAEPYKAWDRLCEAYSEKTLRYVTDKAVALSGLAQEFQASCPNDTYVAGLWRSRLPNSLLWKSSSQSGRHETHEYIAPSWSWLSIDGSISHHAPSETEHSLIDIIRVATDPAIPSEPTASLRSASLHLRGYLRPVEIRPDYERKPWYMLAIGGGKRHRLIVKDGGQEIVNDHRLSFGFSFDVPSEENSGPTSVAGYFLPVCIEQPTESAGKVIRGLLVEPVSDDLMTFRRIGIMSVEGPQCLPIQYRLKNHQDNDDDSKEENSPLWSALEDLMRPSYEELESLRQDTEDDDGKAESQSGANDRDNETQIGAIETEEQDVEGRLAELTVKEEEAVGAELDGEKEGNDAVDDPQPKVDLSSIDALERMYALDSTFVKSELEAQFECPICGINIPVELQIYRPNLDIHSAKMSAPHATLSAATDDRKARLAKLKSLKRKQPEDEIVPPESDRHVSPAQPAPAAAGEEEKQEQQEQKQQQQELEKETARIQLSGRNYDPETKGPKLGFEAPPTLGPDEKTLEEQAAELEAEIRRKAAEEAKEDKGIDLFKLQPKKPNWDLKRELNKKLDVLNVRTDNAIARLVRERLQEKKVETQKKDGNVADGEAVAAGMEGGELEEIVRLREREEEAEERRENEAIDAA
ncbi:hypothetical protein VMCG_07883 [Cytospora schulzeri]|uniref:Heterokaryon incompatibility domain-containing protein n=1 Tax=Cytospora schulzeri TaxID=448051 RepID=A0A423W0E4_9PEZI|nr:hypothetical protein VMCG_07883 [Valsa malicola]